METALYIVQILIAGALIAAVLLQAKGSGLGGIFGGDGAVYKSRRGVERILFHVTIGLVVAFFAIALVSVVDKTPLKVGGILVGAVVIGGVLIYLASRQTA